MTDSLDNSPASQSSGMDSYAPTGNGYPYSRTESVPHEPPPTNPDVPPPPRQPLSAQEKEARKLKKEKRAKREGEELSQLTEKQQAVIEEALGIIRETKSRWLVMVFKRVAAVRSRELFLGEPERFFEPAGSGNYWREGWHDRELGRKEEYANKKRLGAFIARLLDLFGK